MSLAAANAVAVESWQECEALSRLVPRYRGCEICDHRTWLDGSLCCTNAAFTGAHPVRVAVARSPGQACGPEAAFQRHKGVLLR